MRLVTSGVIAAAFFGLFQIASGRFDLLGTHPHRHRTQNNVWADVVGGILGLVLAVGVLLLIWRLLPQQRRRRLASAWSLAAPQRRRMDRAIRRGLPSQDPALSDLEHARAVQARRYRWTAPVLFGLFAAGAITEAVTAETVRATVFFMAATAFFMGYAAYSVVYARGAGRYLRAVDRREPSA